MVVAGVPSNLGMLEIGVLMINFSHSLLCWKLGSLVPKSASERSSKHIILGLSEGDDRQES